MTSCHGKPKIVNIDTFSIALQFQDLDSERYSREQRIHIILPALSLGFRQIRNIKILCYFDIHIGKFILKMHLLLHLAKSSEPIVQKRGVGCLQTANHPWDHILGSAKLIFYLFFYFLLFCIVFYHRLRRRRRRVK